MNAASNVAAVTGASTDLSKLSLRHVAYAVEIGADAEKIWAVLSQYGNVSKFHAGVHESHRVEGNPNQAGEGCERVCNIVDMGLNIQLMERIVDYQEGRSYRYEVYEWKNFPISKMFFGFTIQPSTSAATVLRIDIDYRGRPAFLTPLLAPKMRKLARDVLLGYKHYIESGEARVPIKALRVRYANI